MHRSGGARREKKVEGLGIKQTQAQAPAQQHTQQRGIALHWQDTAGTSHSRHAPLCLIAGAGTVRRTGPWQETGSIDWPLDRTLHSVVHMPPNCTECAPFCRACATTQRQVNTRQSPAVQPPGFPPAPNRRTCKQTWTRYLGGICRCCVPNVPMCVRPVAQGRLLYLGIIRGRRSICSICPILFLCGLWSHLPIPLQTGDLYHYPRAGEAGATRPGTGSRRAGWVGGERPWRTLGSDSLPIRIRPKGSSV